MSDYIIQQELEKRLAAMSPNLSTAYENVAFKPVEGTPYQRAFFLPAQTENNTIGSEQSMSIGIFQVSLYYPKDIGKKAALERAELTKAQFSRGWGVTVSNVRILVDRSPYISGGFNSDGWFVIPVTIPYIADIT